MPKRTHKQLTKLQHFGLGVLGIVAAWLVFLRASDTGSLQQYGILTACVIFSLIQLSKSIRRTRKNDQNRTS
ncbi:MAG: hypothetical protein NTV95_01335 [Candidatus Saccharibacteria bacterium]|nr:hypothetical protein [Candidatus Saccharibacteria bacterium]